MSSAQTPGLRAAVPALFPSSTTERNLLNFFICKTGLIQNGCED